MWNRLALVDLSSAAASAALLLVIVHVVVLQLALARLIAHRAIDRMVDEQELEHRLLRRLGLRRSACARPCRRSRACCRRSGAWAPSRSRPGTSGSCRRSSARDGSSSAGSRFRPLGRLDHIDPVGDVDAPGRRSSALGIGVLTHAAVSAPIAEGTPAEPHVLLELVRNLVTKLCTGIARPSASTQMVLPSMLLAMISSCPGLPSCRGPLRGGAAAFRSSRVLRGTACTARTTHDGRSARRCWSAQPCRSRRPSPSARGPIREPAGAHRVEIHVHVERSSAVKTGNEEPPGITAFSCGRRGCRRRCS